MDKLIDISTVLNRIEELKSSSLLPRNWVKIIAARRRLSTTIIRDWATGRKNAPDGAIIILEDMNTLLKERRDKIKVLTSSDHQNSFN